MRDSSSGLSIQQWQRLAPSAVLLLFLRGLGRFVRENLPLLLGAGAGAALIEDIGLRELLLAALGLLLVAGLISLQYYRRFRFRLENDVLLVQKGLFERTELKISADRVQQIALEQPAYLRPFDVVRFSADTPGGTTTEVELPGIRREVAEALRQALGTARQRDKEDGRPAAALPTEELYRIGAGGLTLHGVASNYAYLLAAALTPLLQPLERLVREHVEDPADLPGLTWAVQHPLSVAALALLALVVLLVAISVATAWLRFFGYRLVRQGDRFMQHSGLLTQREQVLSTGKLQSVDWVQTAIGRALGRGHLVCHQYGGAMQGADQLGRSFLIPGLTPRDAQRLGAAFWPGLTVGGFRPVHRRYRRVQALRIALAAALGSMVVTLATGAPGWLLIGALGVLVAWPLAHLRWRAVGWQQGGRYLLVRHGLLGRRTAMFPLDKVQTVTLRQSWFQRRHDLATLRLALASGPVGLPYLAASDALRLADLTLYRVECATGQGSGDCARRSAAPPGPASMPKETADSSADSRN